MFKQLVVPLGWVSSARPLVFAAMLGSFAWSPIVLSADTTHNVEDHEHEEMMLGKQVPEPKTPRLLGRNARKVSAIELRQLQLAPDTEPTVPELEMPSPPDIVTQLFGTTCIIAFRDRMALTILPDNAKFTFASPPWYIQGCGSGWFHFLENSTRYQDHRSNYGHYHLGWDGFCIDSSGNPGKMSGGSCVAVDPVNQDRSVNPHQNDTWLRGYVYKRGVPEMSFDLLEIRVRSVAVKLLVRKTAGNWLQYDLPVGYWRFNNDAEDIREILISGQRGSGIWEIDDVKIRVP